MIGLQIFKEKLQTTYSLDILLSAAQKLLLCELYHHPSSGLHTWDSWKVQISGMATIVQASASLRTEKSLYGFLLHQFRHASLMQSLIFRRETVDRRAWQISSDTPLPEVAETIVQLALRLPDLLESVESVKSRSIVWFDNLKAIDTMSRLLDLEQDFEKWASKFEFWVCKMNGQELSPCMMENLQGIGSMSLFHSTCQSFYWTCLLLLRTALLDLSICQPQCSVQRSLSAEITLCAEGLCKLVEMQIQQAENLLSKVFAVRAPLHFASEWFQQVHNYEKLQWCQAQETQLREELSFLNWDAALLWSFMALHWLA